MTLRIFFEALPDSPAASEQQAERGTCQQSAKCPLAVMDGDESRVSRADLEYADRNCAHAASASFTFAFGLGVTHAAGSGTGAESGGDLRNWDDGFLAGGYRIAENTLHLRPASKIFVQ
jgi:hypothetical protein